MYVQQSKSELRTLKGKTEVVGGRGNLKAILCRHALSHVKYDSNAATCKNMIELLF